MLRASGAEQPVKLMSNTAYELAKEQYAVMGVDTEAAIVALDNIPVSMHCWQGDDVAGFEAPEKGGCGQPDVLQPVITLAKRRIPRSSCKICRKPLRLFPDPYA